MQDDLVFALPDLDGDLEQLGDAHDQQHHLIADSYPLTEQLRQRI
jgi:hypothetical protein